MTGLTEDEMRARLETLNAWFHRMLFRNGLFTYGLSGDPYEWTRWTEFIERDLRRFDELSLVQSELTAELRAARDFLTGPTDGIARRLFAALKRIRELEAEVERLNRERDGAGKP